MSATLSHGQEEGGDLVGQIRRIGDLGPVYEVVAAETDGVVRIRLVESGTTAKYPLAEARQDPRP